MRRRFYTNKKNILPLYIEAKEDGVCFRSSNTALTVHYRIDMGDWITLESAMYSQSISKGQRLYIKSNTTFTFSIIGRCKIGGDIRSIQYGDSYKIFNGGNYIRVFYDCTTIEEVEPNLLQYVTDLSDYCYESMFEGCTSLTTAPELPVTILTSYCYSNMFNDCSKLNYIKMLATDISASGCLYSWVYNVASTGTFVKNPAMTTLPTGASGIPSGWTVVNDGEESGGSSLTFPVTLVDGDNGQVGIDLFNYLIDKYGRGYYGEIEEDVFIPNNKGGETKVIEIDITFSITFHGEVAVRALRDTGILE